MGLSRFFLNFNVDDVSKSLENVLNVLFVSHKFTWNVVIFSFFSRYWVWNDRGDKSRVL